MKKTRVLGVALTLAATMAVGTAMGQQKNIPTTNNFVELKSAGNGTNQAGVGYVFDDNAYVQKGATLGFYAKPDEAFHPDYYTTGKEGTLTADFTWDWTLPTGYSKVTAVAGDPANFVRIKVATTAAAGKILVKEKMPTTGAWGGCSDAAGFDFNVVPFDEPSFSILTSSSTPTYGDANKIFCGAADAVVNFKLLSSGTPYFKYKVDWAEATINASGAPEVAGAAVWTAVTTSKTVKPAAVWTADNVAATTGTFTAGVDGEKVELVTPLKNTGDLGVYTLSIQKNLPDPIAADPKIKAFRITLTGVNGLISRMADYNQLTGAAPATIENFTYYPTTAADKSYIVYVAKKPTTGPVFHIGNNKAN